MKLKLIMLVVAVLMLSASEKKIYSRAELDRGEILLRGYLFGQVHKACTGEVPDHHYLIEADRIGKSVEDMPLDCEAVGRVLEKINTKPPAGRAVQSPGRG